MKLKMKCKDIEEHGKLHNALDQLVACFIEKTGKLPSHATVMELLKWSFEQTQVDS